MKTISFFLLTLLLLPLVAGAQVFSANSYERELVRRELTERIGRERGNAIEIRVDSAEVVSLSTSENSVRGQASLRERNRNWEVIWFDVTTDQRRSRVLNSIWGYGQYDRNRQTTTNPNDTWQNNRTTNDQEGRWRNGRWTEGNNRGRNVTRYEIELAATNRLLVADRGQVIQRVARRIDAELWDFEPLNNNYYLIRSVATGDVITWQGRGNNGTAIVLAPERANDEAQMWEMRSGADGTYYLVARNGMSLDAVNTRRDGGRVELYNYRNGNDNQRLRLRVIDNRGNRNNSANTTNDNWDNSSNPRPRDENWSRNGNDPYAVPRGNTAGGSYDSRLGAGRMRWQARVDGTVEIEIRGYYARERNLDGQPVYDARASFGSGLPRNSTQVRVNRLRGRGKVEVIAQPSPNNGYTAVIRIADDERGANDYEIEVSWN